MKKINLIAVVIISLLLLIPMSRNSYADLTIDDSTYSVTELVKDILLGGGVTVNSITFSGRDKDDPSYDASVGTFNGEESNIGIDKGIFLGSGRTKDAPGPNSSWYTSYYIDTDGDDDLDQIINPYSTYDATVIKFEFVPLFKKISFKYVFASEEYREFVCSPYNDVFGFFISGSGIDGDFTDDAVNIATIPDTNIYVAINNVNDACHDTVDGADSYCSNWGSCDSSFSEYFVCNTSTCQDSTTVEFDGFTKVFTAEIDSLTPCKKYVIKLAVADASDQLWDSGVFLEAGSFESLGEYGSTEATVCSDEKKKIGPDSVSGVTYTWTDPNGYLNDTSYANPTVQITNTSDTNQTYKFPLKISDCVSTTFTVTVYPEPDPDISGKDTVCPNASDEKYSVTAASGSSYTWTISSGAGITTGTNSNSISVDFGDGGENAVIYITVREMNSNGCIDTDTIVVSIKSNPTPLIAGNIYFCQNETGDFEAYMPKTGSTYSWSCTGGTPTSGSGTDFQVTWGTGTTGEVTLTETDKYGCEGTYKSNITIWPRPEAVISGETDVCAGGTENYDSGDDHEDPMAMLFYNWDVSGGAAINGADDEQTVELSLQEAAGTAALTLYKWAYYSGNNETQCIDTAEITITIHELSPVINCKNMEEDCMVCANEDGVSYTTESVEGGVFEWNVTGGTISSGTGTNEIEIDWGSAGTGEVSVKVTDANGCIGYDTLSVTINPLPTPRVTGDEYVCENGSGDYSVEDTEGHYYIWSVGSGGTIEGASDQRKVTVNWTTPGNHKVYVTQTSEYGCETTDDFPVNVTALPTPSLGECESVCAYSKGVEYSTAYNDGHQYDWSVSGGTITENNGNSILIDWGAAGTGEVSVTETIPIGEGESGCSQRTSCEVIINALPTPEISGESDVCDDEKGLIYQTQLNDGSNYNWSISGAGTITNGELTHKVTVNSGVGTSTLIVTEFDANDCTASDTIEVTTHEYPDPLISGTDELCEYTSTVQYSTNYDSDNTYSWEVIGGDFSEGSNPAQIIVDWGESGNGEVIVTETSEYGCESEDSYAVTIHPNPEPSISGDDDVCEQDAGVQYLTQSNSGSTYFWSVTGGNIVQDNGAGILVDWGNSGSGEVSVKEISIHECEGTDTFPVTINPKPEPVISGPNETCQNGEEVTYSTRQNSGNNYSWSVSGGEVVGSQNQNTITVIWGAPGTGKLTVTEVNQYGCEASDDHTVTIYDNPAPDIQGVSRVCAMTKRVEYSTEYDPDNSYDWNVTGGNYAEGSNPAAILIDWGSGPSGRVSVTETSEFGCDGSDVLEIQIDPIPEPKVTGKTDPCEGESGVIYSTKSNRNNSFTWEVTGGTILSGQGASRITVEWNGPGSSTVKVTETTEIGCSASDELQVTVHENPEPVIAGEFELCAEEEGEVYSTVDNPAWGYKWTVNRGTLMSGQGTSSITVNWGKAGTGRIEVVVTSEYGCRGEAAQDISIYPYPEPRITGDKDVCAEESGIIYTTQDNTAEGNTYRWTIAGGQITSGQTTPEITVQWGDAGTGTLSVTETSIHGCPTTVNYTVTKNPLPEAGITGPVSSCAHNYSEFSTTAERGTTTEWSVDGGQLLSPVDALNIKVLWGNAGRGTVTLKQVILRTGCSRTTNRSVDINPLPEPIVSGNAKVCGTSTHTYFSMSNEGVSNHWKVLRGTITGDHTGRNIDVEWDELGSGVVTLIQTTEDGCIDSTEFNVRINRLPSAQIVGDREVCANNFITYTTSCNIKMKYRWSVTGGSIIGSSTENDLRVRWGSPGEGKITVVKTNEEGCEITVNRDVTIYPLPNPSIEGSKVVCVGGTDLYSANVISGSGTESKWSVIGGRVIGLSDRAEFSIMWERQGVGKIKVIQINKFGCVDSAEIEVTIQPGPEPSISGENEVCKGSTQNYTTPANPGMENQWSVDGGTINGPSTGNSIEVTWQNTGKVVLVQTNTSTGCIGTTEFDVTVNPLPIVSLTVENYCLNDPAGTLDGGMPDGGTYSGPGITGDSFDPAAAGIGDHEITYSYTDQNGCTGSAKAAVTVHPIPDKPTISVTDNTLTSSDANGYRWKKDGADLGGATNQTYIANVEGDYSVVVTNQYGCENESDIIHHVPVGVSRIAEEKGIRIYPNPADQMIHIVFETNEVEYIGLQLSNLEGKVCCNESIERFSGKFHRKIDVSNYVQGVYWLHLQFGEEVYKEKIVIQK